MMNFTLKYSKKMIFFNPFDLNLKKAIFQDFMCFQFLPNIHDFSVFCIAGNLSLWYRVTTYQMVIDSRQHLYMPHCQTMSNLLPSLQLNPGPLYSQNKHLMGLLHSNVSAGKKSEIWSCKIRNMEVFYIAKLCSNSIWARPHSLLAWSTLSYWYLSKGATLQGQQFTHEIHDT